MEDARGDAMAEAFSRFIATVATTRTSMQVRQGNHVSDVDTPAPVASKMNLACRSCKAPTHGRVLCPACRASPTVEYGPPLHDIMFRSSHKKYEIPRGSDKETVLMILHAQKHLATEAAELAEGLFVLAGAVNRKWRQTNGEFPANVCFTPGRVNRGGAYHRSVRCGASGFSNRSMNVGGLGAELHGVVKQHVAEWLFALDATLREELEIPLSRDVGDNSLVANLSSFATLIANRVLLMEEPSEDDPTLRLCALGCELVADIQYLRCSYHTAARVKRDVHAMRLLRKLVLDAPDLDLTNEEVRSPLLELLLEPPPELLAGLSTVPASMHVSTLRDALGLLESEGLDATRAAVEAWRLSISVEFLCMLIDKAITAANTWKRQFLSCLQPAHERNTGAAALPVMGWVDAAHATKRWRLISKATHRQRRTGLDPTGLRIVLVSSALMQLMGCETPPFFVPGVVRCEIMHGVAGSSMEVSHHAIEELREQMRPLTMGIEWMHSREQMRCWQNSHVDTRVRKAFSLLGGFSYQELRERFLGDVETICNDCGERCSPGRGCRNEWCGCRHTTTQWTISDALQRKILPRVSMLMLPERPKRGYVDWLGLSIKIAMPMLLELRQSLGFGGSVRTNRLGDYLRLFPSMRAWQPSHGEITLTLPEVRDVPVLRQLLLEQERRGDGLAKKKRPKTTEVWAFNPAKLWIVLGPAV